MGFRRKFTKEFKLDAVQRLRAGEPAGLVARSLEVSRQELYRWSRDVDKFGERAFPGVGQKRAEETRIAELERKIGQQVLEIDFDDFDSGAPWRPEISDKRSKNALASASSPRTLKHFRILVIHK